MTAAQNGRLPPKSRDSAAGNLHLCSPWTPYLCHRRREVEERTRRSGEGREEREGREGREGCLVVVAA